MSVARSSQPAVDADGGGGPIAVPRKTSDLARPGRSALITAARIAGRWHLIEVGTVYPREPEQSGILCRVEARSNGD